MDLRLAPLPGHVEYFLDCAVESYELDASTHLILRLYGAADEIAPIVGGPRHIPDATDLDEFIRRNQENLRIRRAKCAELSAVADATLLRLPPEEAGGLAYRGLAEIPHRIEDLASILAQWAVTDETVGGDLKNFRKVHRLNHEDDPSPRLARRLASPRFIRHFIRNNDSVPELTQVVERSLARAACVPAQLLQSHYVEAQKLLRKQMEAARQREYTRMLAPKFTADTKRMLRRAASTAVAVVGREAVSAFIRGDDVTLPGEKVTLVIARRGSLAAIGHGQVAVAVKDHDGADLGQICVFFKGTPALDQLTAFALHMQAGLEERLIEDSNITSATERGLEHPLFARIKRMTDRLTEPPATGRMRSTWERDRERVGRYLIKTSAIWNERLSTHVLGRRRPWLDETIAAGRRTA